METRPLAWNGIALVVPRNWELARYLFPGRGVARIEVEDEYALRLELDWLADAKGTEVTRFLASYDRAATNLTRKADHRTVVDGCAEGWQVTRYEFRETLPTRRQGRGLGIAAHSLLTAMYTARDSSFVCRLCLHFLPGDPEEPEALIRLVTGSLTWRQAEQTQWTLFDIDFEMSREFLLEATSFDIGNKLMVFRRGGRRLYRWFLSCADQFLNSTTAEEVWVTGFLNGQRQVPGIVFWPGAAGTVTWRRRRRHMLCHRDELSRWCFRYTVGYRRDRNRNQLQIWVFNYRREEDRHMLPQDLTPSGTVKRC